MVYKFFNKETGSGASVNEKLAQELHKSVIKNPKRRKTHARFNDNVLAADLVEIGSISSKNRGVEYLLCLIDAFTKNVWVKRLKDKKAKTVLNGFVEIVNKSKRKPNILWVDQEREFYNNLMQKSLDDNDILMYSTHNKGMSIVAERFIKSLKGTIFRKWQLMIVNLIVNVSIS